MSNAPLRDLIDTELNKRKDNLPDEYIAEVQIRQAGETRYGKGEIEITRTLVRLAWKKFMGKRQEASFPRSDIAGVEFRDRELPFEIVGPGFNWDQGWITLELSLRDGGGYTIYVGQLGILPPKKLVGFFDRFLTIYLMLSSDREPSVVSPEASGTEPEARGADHYDLACPSCGTVQRKSWICFQCQNEEVPYYTGGQMNHRCSACGFDKLNILPDPELLCESCGRHGVSSLWKPGAVQGLCSSCGTEVSPTDSFCGGCGTRINQ